MDDDRHAARVGRAQRCHVVDAVELERAVTSTVPASASSGTFRPVAPNQRSRPVTARPSRPAAGATSSMPAGSRLAQRLGRPGQQRERPVVARDDARRADELGRDRRLPRPHREVVADRQDRDVGRVDPPDQGHVAEDVRVAGEVQRRQRPASRRRTRTTRRCRSRCSDDEWFAWVSVTRDAEQVDAAALVERLRHVGPDLDRRGAREARPGRSRGRRTRAPARRRRRRGRRGRG